MQYCKYAAVVLLLFWIVSPNVKAQTFGFGCLGFAGAYGGFTYQQYDAAGLNEFVTHFNNSKFSSSESGLNNFSYATGYRIGINLFRATFPAGLIITAKGYYQSLGKENSASENSNGNTINCTFDLNLKNWAVGFDIGLDVFKSLSWKIIDGSLNFNNVRFTITENSPGETIVKRYESDSGVLGYSVGTGVIIAIIPDYISIEGLAGYTSLKIEDVKNNLGTPLQIPNNEAQNIIESGGFTTVIQLNVGIPL